MKYLFHERTAYCRFYKPLLIMRLTIFLVLAFVLNAAARGTAQTVSLSVSKMPLEKVFKEIEKATGYSFVYANDLSKGNYLISADIKDASIGEALKVVFHGLPFSFQIIEKIVVINTVTVRANDQSGNISSNQNSIDVNGIVFSELGQPLGGASVMVKATNRTVLTNARGEFSLRNIPDKSVIVISFIGYSPKQVSALQGSVMRVSLALSDNELDATVIKGYYNTSNRLNTGNVTVVKGEDIQKQPVTDPLLALVGRVPGLYIQQSSGIPGAYSKVQLRGKNSIANGVDPLYIVDGVPYNNTSLTSSYISGGAVGGTSSNMSGRAPINDGTGLSPFNNLNPNDIENIEVLKDADATAIYGSRGANGVILITTHKGKIGRTRVDFDVSSGAGKVPHMLNMMNTGQYLKMRREAFMNDGVLPDTTIDFDLTFWDSTRNTDWQKELIGGTASFQRAQANLSGGSVNCQYLIGAGYSNQGTLFGGNNYDKKGSVHLSLTSSSNDQKIKSQLNLSFVNDNNRIPTSDLTNYLSLAPDAPALYDSKGQLNWQVKGGAATWSNPLADIRNQANSVTDNLVSSLNISYQLLKGLEIRSNFGYTNSQMNQSVLFFGTSAAPPDNDQDYSRVNQFASAQNKSWVIEPQIGFNKHFGKIGVEALVGSTFQESSSRSIGQIASTFSSDALVPNPGAGSSLRFLNYFVNQYRYNALYGRVGFSILSKYLVNFTARRDGSSKFGPGKQFGNFGAIGIGWILSNEAIIQDKLPWISFGKIRMSYGSTGNDQLADYKYLDTYSTYLSGSYQNIVGLFPTQLTNPYFAWERVNKYEVGLDLGFFHDRLLMNASYYRNRTNNQLVGYPLPYITGFTTVQYNLAAIIQNSGWEISLNSRNYESNNFSWSSYINVTLPKNKLVAYPLLASSTYASTYQVGKSLYIRNLFSYIGVNPQTGLYNFSSKTNSGKPVFGKDQIFSEPITTTYYGGIGNKLTFSGFQLDFFVQFVKQNGFKTVFSQPGSLINGFTSNQLQITSSVWQRQGDNASIMKFSQSVGDPYTAYNSFISSNALITDASFIRFKNISLSYELPAQLLKMVSVNSVKLYVQAQNLFTITSYVGLNPESSGSIALPPLRIVSGGLQVSL